MDIQEIKDIVDISIEDIVLNNTERFNLFIDYIGKDTVLWSNGNKVGGHQVSIPKSNVILTHIPTGIIVQANEYRSIHTNRNLAILKLLMKLNE